MQSNARARKIEMLLSVILMAHDLNYFPFEFLSEFRTEIGHSHLAVYTHCVRSFWS